MDRYYFFVSFYCKIAEHADFKSFTYYTDVSFPSMMALRRYAEERFQKTFSDFVPLSIQALTREQYDCYEDN
jgi:hypothetical protein